MLVLLLLLRPLRREPLRRVRIPDARESRDTIEVGGHHIPKPPPAPTETETGASSASAVQAPVERREYALNECD